MSCSAPRKIRVLDADRAVEIPRIRDTALASARFVRRNSVLEQRIIESLHFPGHDSLFDIDVPAAAAGAVNTVGTADDLVVLPAVSVKLFPGTRFRD